MYNIIHSKKKANMIMVDRVLWVEGGIETRKKRLYFMYMISFMHLSKNCLYVCKNVNKNS